MALWDLRKNSVAHLTVDTREVENAILDHKTASPIATARHRRHTDERRTVERFWWCMSTVPRCGRGLSLARRKIIDNNSTEMVFTRESDGWLQME